MLGAVEARAEEPFVSSLVERATGGWDVTVAGGGRKPGALELWADGTRVVSRLEPLPAGDRTGNLSGRIAALPEGARRLELRRNGTAIAALDLAPLAPEPASFARWTIYHVMLEMFADGDVGNNGELTGWRHPRYAGGDLRGVLDKADYLQELGVNAVWLSPMFEAQTSHGYDVQSYYRVGDAVGVAGQPAASLELFRRLREALAQRGIRTILDLPLNHASRNYDRKEGDPLRLGPRVTDARQEAEKLWESWDAGYQYWNFDHPPTREFLRQAALYWLRDEKVDGLRLDYARGVPHDFWAELFRAVKGAKKEAFLVGECWIDTAGAEANARDIATYYAAVPGAGRQFDSQLDFPMQSVLGRIFARGESLVEAERWLQLTAATYGEGALPTYFLDNHDLARFSDRVGDRALLLAALGYVATLDGPLVLFYGTETGLGGGEAKEGFTDSGRIPMPWSALDRELSGRVSILLKARAAHSAMSSGARRPLLVEPKTLVVAKVDGHETLLVGVNLAREAREITLEIGSLVPPGSELAAVVGEAAARVDAEGRLHWTLPPSATVIAGR